MTGVTALIFGPAAPITLMLGSWVQFLCGRAGVPVANLRGLAFQVATAPSRLGWFVERRMALGKWIESCRAHMLRHPTDAAKKPKLVGNSDDADIALSAAPPWTLPHTTLGLVNNALLKRSAAAKLYASTRYPNTSNRGTNPPAALEFELATSCHVALAGRLVALAFRR